MQWSDTIETNLVEGYRAASSWIMGMSFFDSGTLQVRAVGAWVAREGSVSAGLENESLSLSFGRRCEKE